MVSDVLWPGKTLSRMLQTLRRLPVRAVLRRARTIGTTSSSGMFWCRGGREKTDVRNGKGTGEILLPKAVLSRPQAPPMTAAQQQRYLKRLEQQQVRQQAPQGEQQQAVGPRASEAIAAPHLHADSLPNVEFNCTSAQLARDLVAADAELARDAYFDTAKVIAAYSEWLKRASEIVSASGLDALPVQVIENIAAVVDQVYTVRSSAFLFSPDSLPAPAAPDGQSAPMVIDNGRSAYESIRALHIAYGEDKATARLYKTMLSALSRWLPSEAHACADHAIAIANEMERRPIPIDAESKLLILSCGLHHQRELDERFERYLRDLLSDTSTYDRVKFLRILGQLGRTHELIQYWAVTRPSQILANEDYDYVYFSSALASLRVYFKATVDTVGFHTAKNASSVLSAYAKVLATATAKQGQSERFSHGSSVALYSLAFATGDDRVVDALAWARANNVHPYIVLHHIQPFNYHHSIQTDPDEEALMVLGKDRPVYSVVTEPDILFEYVRGCSPDRLANLFGETKLLPPGQVSHYLVKMLSERLERHTGYKHFRSKVMPALNFQIQSATSTIMGPAFTRTMSAIRDGQLDVSRRKCTH